MHVFANYEWLFEAPQPRTVRGAMFLTPAPGETPAVEPGAWLLAALADAGKIKVEMEPIETVGGALVVNDINPEIIAHAAELGRDLQMVDGLSYSDGAARLKRGSTFDPARVGKKVRRAVCGDIVIGQDVAGICVGDDSEHYHVLTMTGAVRLPFKDAEVRRPPLYHGYRFRVSQPSDSRGPADPVGGRSCPVA